MTKEIANNIRELFNNDKLRTDSDIQDFLEENNRKYQTFSDEEFEKEGFLESEEYKAYEENPNVVSFVEVLKVIANSVSKWKSCHGCENIHNLFYGGCDSICANCSRHIVVADLYKKDKNLY